MKKLICVRDVQEAFAKGEKAVYINDKTIITPSALDFAKANDIVFTKREKVNNTFDIAGVEPEKLYQVLKILVDRGLLDCTPKPYEYEKDPCGLKLVRGSSVKMDPLDAEKTGDKVTYQEVIHENEVPMTAGYFNVNKAGFNATAEVAETYYIIEGSLNVKINGKEYVAVAGDTLTIPKGSEIEGYSDRHTRIFYACSTN